MLQFRSIAFIFTLLVSVCAQAKMILQSSFNYEVTPEIFLKKNISYALETYTYRKLTASQSELAEIVETVFPRARRLNYIVSKSSYLINRPINSNESQDFFKDLEFFKKFFNAQSVKREANVYQVSSSAFNYHHHIFYDSNDMSTLDQSRLMRSINLIKKMDVISQGSFLTVIHHQKKFNKVLKEGIIYQMFIPIKDNLTLVLNYGIFGTHNKKLSKSELRRNLEGELIFQQTLLNNLK